MPDQFANTQLSEQQRPRNPRRALEHLLTPEQMRLYRFNAWFKAVVDQWLQFSEVMLEGAASQAEEKDAQMQKDMEAIMAFSPYPMPERD